MANSASHAPPADDVSQPHSHGDDGTSRQSPFQSQIDLPPLPDYSPHTWNKTNEKQLRSALLGACKRLPRNAEAHFHLGLMHLRNADSEEALRAFQHCRHLYSERIDQYVATHGSEPPSSLCAKLARVRSHAAQAAHLTAQTMSREQRAPVLEKLQKELVAATKLDVSQLDVWNSLALLHLKEGGHKGARDVLLSIRQKFPDYLDALNNFGLAELALGNEEAAISCFQKVILLDREHVEALSNYAVVLLRHGMYDAAIRSFEAAVDTVAPDTRGLAFAWGGLAVARAALGQLDAAEIAARRAEQSAEPSNRSRFSMLRTSIYARRIVESLRRGLAWDEDGAPALESPDRQSTPSSPSSPAVDAPSGESRPPAIASARRANSEYHADVDSDTHSSTLERQRQHNHSRISVDKSGNAPSQRRRARDRSVKSSKVRSGGGTPSEDDSPPIDSGARVNGSTSEKADIPARTTGGGTGGTDARAAMDGAVLRLRALARDINSSSASTALGAALRLRHECSMEESGNRNFGAEAAERLVEALENDESNATAWVQLSLLQLGTGEYLSAREFAVQGVSRDVRCEAGWNALAVAMQLNDESDQAMSSYLEAVRLARTKHSIAGGSDPSAMSNRAEEADDEERGAALLRTLRAADDERDENLKTETNRGRKSATLLNDETRNRELDEASNENLGREGSSKMYVEENLNEAGRMALAALYNNIGNMHRQEGHSVSEAFSAYEKSLRVGGENAVVYNNLALLYISTGRFDDAGNMLDHALKLDPNLYCAISNRLKLTALLRRNERHRTDSDDGSDFQKHSSTSSDEDEDESDDMNELDEHDLGTDSPDEDDIREG